MIYQTNSDSFSGVPCEDPRFFPSIFSAVVSAPSQPGEMEALFDLAQEAQISFWMDETGVQESFEFRAKRRSLRVAEFILDEKGNFDSERIQTVKALLEGGGYIPFPEGFCDERITRHFVWFIKRLEEYKTLSRKILQFHVPLCHAWAEELVRDSVGIGADVPLTNRHVRVAVLSACLTVLRQNVGSCFATAPAILIQSEQPERLVDDLFELLGTGRLERTFGGAEFSVPLSPSSGAGDLFRKIENSERVLKSPGLQAAWKAAGVEPDATQIFKFLQEAAARQESPDIEDLIHHVLLAHFRLEEGDLIAHAKKQKTLARQAGIAGSMGDRAGFAKMQSCDACLACEKRAKAAFKALTHHPLLKAWEFTLASFSEGKMEFSDWNLYASLGFAHEEPGGVGDVLYRALDIKLKENNEKVEEYHADYVLAADQLRATELLLQQASTEAEIRRLKAEHSVRLHHMQSCLERRDDCHKISSIYVNFFAFLIEEYKKKFQEYFQEIYDADMHDVKTGPYEDSPAGFRLVYKHGRSNASLWTMIYTAEEYIDALAEFFHMVEGPIAAVHEWKEAPELISTLTTSVINHVRTDEFLASAIQRMAKVHGQGSIKNPLKTLDSLEKKPWSYTSGGSMKTLLQVYYKVEGSITEEKKWLDDETHLCTFLLDTLKNLPYVDQNLGLLMNSPTHAFLFYPGFEGVSRGMQDPIFTYSWVRDQVILPKKAFYEKMVLSREEQLFLWEEFLQKLPPIIVKSVEGILFAAKASIAEFRQKMVQAFRGKLSDRVDGYLYESLPLTPALNWEEKLSRLMEPIVHLSDENFPPFSKPYISAKKLRTLATAFIVRQTKQVAYSIDVHQTIAKQASLLGLAPPEPFIFADTNWTNFYFALLFNPGTQALELWRVDKTGLSGVPMSSWKQGFDGKEPKEWDIFPIASQYR